MEILGVGNIHSAILAQMKQNFSKADPVYDIKEVKDLLGVFADKTADELKQKVVPKYQHGFINNLIINAILVAATMEKYDIENVHALDVSNVDALMRKAATK